MSNDAVANVAPTVFMFFSPERLYNGVVVPDLFFRGSQKWLE